MGWLLPFSVLAFVASCGVLIGALAFRKRARARLGKLLPRGRSRSPLSAHEVLPESHAPAVGEAPRVSEAVSVHSAKTFEFAAYVEELAALSMQDAPPLDLAVHEAPTREFDAYLEDPVLRQHAGLQPSTRTALERRDEDATLKVGRRDKISPGNRDAAADLARQPTDAPTARAATPVHHTVTRSGCMPKQPSGVSAESERARGQRNGRR